MSTFSTKSFSWKKAALLALGVGLLTAGLSLFVQTHGVNLQAFVGMPLATTSAPVGEGSSFTTNGKPSRLKIPAIGVDAHIQSVGLSWKGTGDMGIPTNFTDVGWYKDGPAPGMPGIAVIDGHLDGKDVPQAVFYKLDQLKAGDLVEVEDTAGNTLQFRVTGSKTYDYDTPTEDIFLGDASHARLNLITCAGSWLKTEKLYNKRVVVTAELVTT